MNKRFDYLFTKDEIQMSSKLREKKNFNVAHGLLYHEVKTILSQKLFAFFFCCVDICTDGAKATVGGTADAIV